MLRPILAVLTAGAVYALQIVLDRWGDDEQFDWSEFLFEDTPEWLAMGVAVALSLYAGLRLRDTLRERRRLAADLESARHESVSWRCRAETLVGEREQLIFRHFADWNLTSSESDVALLMLKGFSHKEIARLRKSAAATVRQQAAAVYAKSGTSNRAELAGLFLIDVLPAATNGSGTGGIRHLPDAGAAAGHAAVSPASITPVG